ncbi:hypothetical protein EJ04DRAFT_547558 [Polyplosphaeria fusca]|uniref:Fe2OG dioxygenase domain-containing protein n=1 Tax=Polyplosphaeria fusca TaxID=682080 RepID=A0A9P4UVC8_9PLEO|nr:hypothetical protein EJ04DRAFT_547558 [Polyplosphaeria fusca]
MAEVISIASPISALKVKPIIQKQLHIAPPSPAHSTFDPSKHLNFVPPSNILSLKDIGLPEDAGISPVAVSEPFPLFTPEAISIMRHEIFTDAVWQNCLISTDFAGCQLRGHCPKYAPFMHSAWTHPTTLSLISRIATIDLIPMYDYEIGNINISVNDPADVAKRSATQSASDLPVTKWHNDSYPFVCVVMMSDATNMSGGETALQTGPGEILKVRGPQMGHAIVLQGRCITHQALAALGGTERITMVTSFRPRDAFVKDTSVLTTIRPLSDLSELYFQWTRYRIEVLQERLRGMQEVMGEEQEGGRGADGEKIRGFLRGVEEWVRGTWGEIV